VLNALLGWFFRGFNKFFSWTSNLYAGSVSRLITGRALVMLLYVGLLAATYYGMTRTPTGFIPPQDKGYLLVDVRLPDSASLERCREVMDQFEKLCGEIPGVDHTMGVTGQSFVQNAVGSNFGSMFVILEPFHHREEAEKKAQVIAGKIRKLGAQGVDEGIVSVFGPPPVDGIGSAGGFKLMLRDIGNLGLANLQSVADDVSVAGSSEPGILAMINGFRSNTPQMYVDIDREKVKTLGVPLQDVFNTLQVQLGGAYANDFNQFGRTWQVNVQADPQYRRTPEQVGQFKVRTLLRQMVPLATFANIRETLGPAMVTRYNGDVAASINGATVPGLSSGDMVNSVQRILDQKLPDGIKPEWTELTYLQLQAGNTALLVFGMAVVLVFLVLAAQYESTILPLSVILVVPMCLLCSVAGVAMVGLDINIFVQIGFVVLVGLASKNAILIVEFAKQLQESGKTGREAVVEACRMRLRPIMMTSFAFILGVIPLVLASGAGSEMRKTLGIAVFSGMLGVTFFGIFLTPVFYFLIAGSRQMKAIPKDETTKVPEVTGH
jgi:multidrug efflux pump